MTVEYKMFGKVVNHPVLKVITVFYTTFFVLTLSPLLIPTHFLLRKSGRNGFYFHKSIVIGKESFAHYEPRP